MGTIKDVELSMRNVRRRLERNHLAYTIEGNSILFNRHYNRRTGRRSYDRIRFLEGADKIGCQQVELSSVDWDEFFGVLEEGKICHRLSHCTDMAFFAFHLRDVFPQHYPVDEYNRWNR